MKQALLVLLLVSSGAHSAAVDRTGFRVASCTPKAFGLDTAQANTYLVFYTGRGYGQTFTTDDTLLGSVTIWRGAPRPIDNTPLRMFITEVDTAGTPDVFRIINSDVVLTIPPGDSVHATAGTWVFSPPLALPHRGMFCFAVHDDLYCLDSAPLLASSANPYGGGRAWRFTPGTFCQDLGPPFLGLGDGNNDMIFTLNFCDTGTPVREPTWGELKARYH
jgi:hypothetical protein